MIATSSDGDSRVLPRCLLVGAGCAVVTAFVCGFLLGPVIRFFFPVMSTVEGVLSRRSEDTVLSYLLFLLSYSWDVLWALLAASFVVTYAMVHLGKHSSTHGIAVMNGLIVLFVTGSHIHVPRGVDVSLWTFALLLKVASMFLALVTSLVMFSERRRSWKERGIEGGTSQRSNNAYEFSTLLRASVCESGPEATGSRKSSTRRAARLMAMFAGCVLAPLITHQIRGLPFAGAESVAWFLLFPGIVVGAVVGIITVSLLTRIFAPQTRSRTHRRTRSREEDSSNC